MAARRDCHGAAGEPVQTVHPPRRSVLTAGLALTTGLAVHGAHAQADPTRARPQAGDLLVSAADTAPVPLTPENVPLGSGQILAWPLDPSGDVVRSGSRLNKVLLVRLNPETMESTTRERSAGGVVAYSAICPHTGCEVTNWAAGSDMLACPCHDSQYDPRAGARLISGPSPRGLAALPLTLNDGKLMVARPFIGRLGIQQT
jgi:rieske iron-sulfur protein